MSTSKTIDRVKASDMQKIYCKCGNIVSIDKSVVRTKELLKKRVECTACRNNRISVDIEYLNSYYDGTLDEMSVV